MSKTDRTALKRKLKQAMLDLEAAELATAQEHYARLLEESKLDDREGHDNSDIAEARENADLAAAFDHPVKDHHAKIDVLENMDFAPCDVIGPGAVVRLGRRRFVVSVSTSEFTFEGDTYMGISQQSPIYKAMDGLEAGETFAFNGRDVKVDEVF
ncbi:MAG: hypothetical protein EP307_09525 [Rhodobacteraceae bacterium]|nr:MAG: hypothetical protein EP307_09525 [Paracoccaceae bacterium]